ncbi:MAG: hypothetical protein QTN59_04715 [Candidatus Electrothrix communis]|nr:MAG: hypothetical protein QTN59_04715 [Candidatus Electrothrix communis]
MPYGKFESIAEVARKFDITVSGSASFAKRLDITIPDYDFSRIEKKLIDELNFINEVTICERIISPILELVSDQYELLKIWSHVPYNVDQEKGLVGEPDYLVAPKTKYGDMGVPPLCIVEAKKDNFEEGWTQALAEMVAASLQGREECYGVVTTGNTWAFGKLEKKVFTRDPKKLSATANLQEIFDVLNWVFYRAEALLGEE